MALWKDAPGYEGLYQVSSDGQVKSLPRVVSTWYRTGERKEKFLKQFLRGRDGLKYKAVALTKEGKTERISVHRLVAMAFLPNPNGFPEVNHKDENTMNNCVENLEWCTREYNIKYSKSKPICQYEKDGSFVAEYRSATDAALATGIKRTSINNVLTGRASISGGYRWAYSD